MTLTIKKPKKSTPVDTPEDVQTDKSSTTVLARFKQGKVKLRIIGMTPMFQNRMSAKAKQQLLLGGRKKTAAEKTANIKHNPIAEFRDALEMNPTPHSLVGLKLISVKAAMSTASINTEGIKKTETQRLLFVPGEFTPLYGTPQLRMDIVRSADMNRTPDVRTRPFFPRWGAEIELHYVNPGLEAVDVATLLFNAGQIIGLGDFRQEKGKGNFGLFRVIGADEEDEEWDDLVANHGRAAQEAAIKNPVFANHETAELMEAFYGEVKRRDK